MKLNPDTAKTLLALHGRFAVTLGLLLYVLIVTGVSSVFAHEIADWSSPVTKSNPALLPPGLDRGLRAAAREVDPRFLDEVSAFPSAGGRIQAFYHTHELHPDSGRYAAIGVEFALDPNSLGVLERREGWAEDIRQQDAANGLERFVTGLHVRLHIPAPYGLVVTGILGLALMVAVVSGFFMHRHLLRDLFTRRGQVASPLAARDRHVGAASWVLPFALVLAFTGSYFSFADSFGLPALARIAFEGDEERLVETLVGVPPVEDARPAALADIDAVIADASGRGGAAPDYLVIRHWGRADSRVSLFTSPADGDLTSPSYVYDGTDGRLLLEKPDFGVVRSTGGMLIGLIFALHYGAFAGVWSKIVWFGLGIGVAFVALTGLLLWCSRRTEVPAWRRLNRAVHWVGFGLPLALAAVPYGYFPARAAGIIETDGWMNAACIAAATLAAILVVAIRDLDRAKCALLGLTGAALGGLPLVRLLYGGPGWGEAITRGLDAVVAVDGAFALAGAACLLAAWRQSRRAGSPLPRRPLP